jgi:hypothetical protein
MARLASKKSRPHSLCVENTAFWPGFQATPQAGPNVDRRLTVSFAGTQQKHGQQVVNDD